MDNLENDIKRKIKVRKFAIKNMGREDTSSLSEYVDEDGKINNLYEQFSNNIQDADQSKTQDGYFPIYSNRKGFGKLIVFIKRGIRKIINILLGWYIKPIFEQQSFFNGKIVNSINLMNQMNQLLITENQLYKQKLDELENKLSFQEAMKSSNITLDEYNNIVISHSEAENEQDKQIISLSDIDKKVKYILDRLNVTCDIELLQNTNIDYFKFEDAFRGTRNGVKEIQSTYVPYFRDKGIILDIGSGRGEFLELMWNHGIAAYGVDSYEPFVNYCNERGFNVIKEDVLTHLNSLEDCSLGGIFMSQVIEHLSNDYINALILIAYKKLKPGCFFILETPNPDCVAALTEFNIDMSHIKPIHYKAIEFLFKEANYQNVNRFHIEQTLYPKNAKHLEGDCINNLCEFNQGIDHINELLFGYRDYTLIAQK